MPNLTVELRAIVKDDLRPETFHAMEKVIRGSMELRVGMRLAEQMSDEQLDEFDAICGDQEAGLAFLDTYFPHHKDLVDQVMSEHLAVVAAAHHIGLLDLP